VRFRIHVAPRSRENRVVASRGDGIVRVRVTAPPEAGKANEAALSLLRERLGLRAGALRLAGGATSRWKWIEADGLDEADLWRRLGAE
jgi:uncharacterized protein YggU (UPF0235/DUF167 family)